MTEALKLPGFAAGLLLAFGGCVFAAPPMPDSGQVQKDANTLFIEHFTDLAEVRSNACFAGISKDINENDFGPGQYGKGFINRKEGVIKFKTSINPERGSIEVWVALQDELRDSPLIEGKGNDNWLFAMLPEGAKDWNTVVYLRFHQTAIELKMKENNNVVWGLAEAFPRHIGTTVRIHFDWGEDGLAFYLDGQLLGRKGSIKKLPLPEKIEMQIGNTILSPPPVLIDEVRISNMQREK